MTRPILHTIAAQSESLRTEIRATRDLFEEKLLRVEQVMDARPKHIEEHLEHR